MTKTLTEQWRERTLGFGYYYVKLPNERPQIYHSDYLKSFTAVKDAGRMEIIAEVPSYDEWKRLQEQLNEANEAIKEYAWDSGYWECGYHYEDSFFADIYIKKWGVK